VHGTREVNVAEVLHLSGVTVRRGTTRLVEDIDWIVAEGERWVVLGPNGAGKSTLLQIAATRIHPTSGVAVILDEYLGLTDVFDLRPRIGVVGTGMASAIPARESVFDAVITASWAVTGRWNEDYEQFDVDRAKKLLDQWGIAHLSDRTFGTLSDGERKRTQIARSLMTDPELLLLDEPTAGLDLGAREQLLSRLSQMADDPGAPATILVTHHVEEIPRGTTHALILAGGRVMAQGVLHNVVTSEVLSAAYATPLAVEQRSGRWAARAAY
jgi:iron complex transport system ATP-binding protein